MYYVRMYIRHVMLSAGLHAVHVDSLIVIPCTKQYSRKQYLRCNSTNVATLHCHTTNVRPPDHQEKIFPQMFVWVTPRSFVCQLCQVSVNTPISHPWHRSTMRAAGQAVYPTIPSAAQPSVVGWLVVKQA